jgi:hypothetical protein
VSVLRKRTERREGAGGLQTLTKKGARTPGLCVTAVGTIRATLVRQSVAARLISACRIGLGNEKLGKGQRDCLTRASRAKGCGRSPACVHVKDRAHGATELRPLTPRIGATST